MPKASFNPKEMYAPGIFQEGNFEVKDAKVVVFQYPPNRDNGEQPPPMTAARLALQKLDDGCRATDDEPFDKIFRIEGDTSRARPGHAKSRDDDEPEDLGDELGTEGNCVYVNEGTQLNRNSIWAVFVAELEKMGFKPDLLSKGLIDDFIGLTAHGITRKSEKRNIRGREVETNYFVVDKILSRPYEKGAKTTADTAKKASAAAGKSANGAPAPPAPSASSDDADSAASAIMAELSAEMAGEKKPTKKFFAIAYSRLMRDKDRNKKLDKEIQDLLRSDEWIASKAEDIGYAYSDGVFTFPEA